MNEQEILSQYKQRLEAYLRDQITMDAAPDRLREAMRYSLLGAASACGGACCWPPARWKTATKTPPCPSPRRWK